MQWAPRLGISAHQVCSWMHQYESVKDYLYLCILPEHPDLSFD